MKLVKHIALILLLLITVCLSCRQEEMELIEPPVEENLVPNSTVAILMQRVSINDGSNDNIIDYANCFNIQLPITVTANGVVINVNSASNYDDIEAVFDASDDDTDYLDISYPITITLANFTEVVISNVSELGAFASTCNGENESDDDIECLDFVYPITASVFNTNNELIETVSISSDSEMFNFIQNIDSNDIITVNFPITVFLSDGTQLVINDLSTLESTIVNFSDVCDEDDDFDYNDDDCNNCTPNQIEDILTSCSNWIVDKLERNDIDYDDVYNNYFFNFFTDGSIVVDYPGGTDYGTWSTSGSGNNIVVVINIPDLTLCNNNWFLHEIQQIPGETKVDLRVGGDDRMRYESSCL